jgi:hypothetical protein
MDTAAITKAANNLAKLERKLAKVTANAEVSKGKAIAKAEKASSEKIAVVTAEVAAAKSTLTNLASAA